MKKKVIGLLSAFAGCCLVAGALVTSPKDAQAEISLAGELQDTYRINQTVELPAGEFNVNGEVYPAETLVYYPNGYTYATNSCQLTVHGSYTVQYRALIDGKWETQEYTFETTKNQFDFQTNASSAVYGTDTTNWNVGNKEEGLMVSLANNDVFTYNEPINLMALEGNPFVKFNLLSTVNGTCDASELHIQLVDSKDESNYIDVKYALNKGTQTYTYINAKATDQAYAGIEYWRDQKVYINSVYGCPITWTPAGNTNTMTTTAQTLYYTKSDNSVWWGNLTHEQFRIIDFDASYQAKPWSGFKSDYAYLRIYASGYVGDTFNILLNQIGDIDLSKTEFSDDEGPAILIDAGKLDLNAMPNATVGTSYKLPDAFATDVYVDNNISVSRRVYYGYARGNGIYTTKSNDYRWEYDTYNGRFTPDLAGEYAIVYSAVDYCGNYSEYVVTVIAEENELGSLTAQLEETYVTEATSHSKITLANVAAISGTEYETETFYSVALGETSIAVQGNALTGYYFIPTQAGEYEVSVMVTDFVGKSKTMEYTVMISEVTGAIFDEDAKLLKYFIRGFQYNLPTLYAKNIVDGTQVEPEIIVVDGLGERTYTGGQVSFIPDATGNATIVYKAGDNQKSYTIPVITVTDGEDLSLVKYFKVSEGDIDIEGKERGIMLTSRDKDGAATFVKPLVQNDLAVKFYLEAGYSNFEFFTFTLQDSLESTQMVKVSLRKTEQGKNAEVWLNDEKTSATVLNPFHQTSEFTITYNHATQTLSDGQSAGVKLTETVLGEAFNGFTSGEVYVTVGMQGVTSRTRIYVSAINDVKINGDIISDDKRPQAYIQGEYFEKVVEKGAEITVYSMVAGDVLSQVVYAAVSVTFNGNPVVSKEGITLSNASVANTYHFVASEMGKYTISYTAIDAVGRSVTIGFYITVQDMVAPVIKGVSGIPTEANVGDVLEIPTTTATDDCDGAVKVTMYVIYPDLTARVLTESKHFTFIQAGTYIVRYMAIDASGNATSLDYKIVAR